MKTKILLSVFCICGYLCYSQIKNVGDTFLWHKINFDTSYKYIHIDTSIQNIWQVGRPQKTYFNSSFSPSRAIVTDTVNAYPVNNYSYFDLFIGDFNMPDYPDDIFIDFWHKYDTDTLKDGGYITVSWDKGQTWINIIHDTAYYDYSVGAVTPGNDFGYPSFNLYTSSNILYTGEYGFSGRSNGWVHTSFAWYMMPCKLTFPQDTMILRFNFISDNINNHREGWMIDNIRLFSIDLGGGIYNLLSGNNISVYPNPATNNLTIEAEQDAVIEITNIQGQLIKTFAATGIKTSIDVSAFPRGVYVVEMITESGVGVKKFVKE